MATASGSGTTSSPTATVQASGSARARAWHPCAPRRTARCDASGDCAPWSQDRRSKSCPPCPASPRSPGTGASSSPCNPHTPLATFQGLALETTPVSESPETPSKRDGAASLWARLALVAGPLAGVLGAWLMTQGAGRRTPATQCSSPFGWWCGGSLSPSPSPSPRFCLWP